MTIRIDAVPMAEQLAIDSIHLKRIPNEESSMFDLYIKKYEYYFKLLTNAHIENNAG